MMMRWCNNNNKKNYGTRKNSAPSNSLQPLISGRRLQQWFCDKVCLKREIKQTNQGWIPLPRAPDALKVTGSIAGVGWLLLACDAAEVVTVPFLNCRQIKEFDLQIKSCSIYFIHPVYYMYNVVWYKVCQPRL